MPALDDGSISLLGPLRTQQYKEMSHEHQCPPPSFMHDPRIRYPASDVRPPLSSSYSFPMPSIRDEYTTYDDQDHASEASEIAMEFDSSSFSSRSNLNDDHQVLCLKQQPSRVTVLDQDGRPSSLNIVGQLHGGFSLSEMTTTPDNGAGPMPELLCYRRNLFSVSGRIHGPAGPLFVVNAQGQSVPIISQELSIHAHELKDGPSTRLIVVPFKTLSPGTISSAKNIEMEPGPIPVLTYTDVNIGGLEHPFQWRRLQFRYATANNGRRRQLQQHFQIRVQLRAHLADDSTVNIADAATVPIVVRGRSPRSFRNRRDREIPAIGSAASSRGHSSHSSPRITDSLIGPECHPLRRPSGDRSIRSYKREGSPARTSPSLTRSRQVDILSRNLPLTDPDYSASQHWIPPANEDGTFTPNYTSPVYQHDHSLPGSQSTLSGLHTRGINLHHNIRPALRHSNTAPVLSSLPYEDQDQRHTRCAGDHASTVSPEGAIYQNVHYRYPTLHGNESYDAREYTPTILPPLSQVEATQHTWQSTDPIHSHYTTTMPPISQSAYVAGGGPPPGLPSMQESFGEYQGQGRSGSQMRHEFAEELYGQQIKHETNEHAQYAWDHPSYR